MNRWLSRSVLATAFVAAATRAGAAEVAVDQRDMLFVPSAVMINAGDSIRFTDTDRIAHDITVVNPDGSAVDRGMVKGLLAGLCGSASQQALPVILSSRARGDDACTASA